MAALPHALVGAVLWFFASHCAAVHHMVPRSSSALAQISHNATSGSAIAPMLTVTAQNGTAPTGSNTPVLASPSDPVSSDIETLPAISSDGNEPEHQPTVPTPPRCVQVRPPFCTNVDWLVPESAVEAAKQTQADLQVEIMYLNFLGTHSCRSDYVDMQCRYLYPRCGGGDAGRPIHGDITVPCRSECEAFTKRCKHAMISCNSFSQTGRCAPDEVLGHSIGHSAQHHRSSSATDMSTRPTGILSWARSLIPSLF